MNTDYEFACMECGEWCGSYDALIEGEECPLCGSTDIDTYLQPESVKLNHGACTE